MKFRLHWLTLALFFDTSINAQTLNLDNFYWRDYMDFGQNLGKFDPNNFNPNSDKDFTYDGKNGVVADFSGIPDFSSRNLAGNVTSLGRNITVTAHHIRCTDFEKKDGIQSANQSKLQTWGNTSYEFDYESDPQCKDPNSTTRLNGLHQKTYGRDTMYVRTKKYIVEGSSSPLDVGFDKNPSEQVNNIIKEKGAYKQERFDKQNELDKELTDYLLKNIKTDKNGMPQAFQSGSGTLNFIIDNKLYGDLKDKENGVVRGILLGHISKSGGSWLLRDDYSSSGQPNPLVRWGSQSSWKKGTKADEEEKQSFNGEGFYLSVFGSMPWKDKDAFKLNPFFAGVDQGDSGSALIAYDTKQNKWVVLGVLSQGVQSNSSDITGASADYSPVLNVDYQNYKKQFENEMKDNDTSKIQANKDNIFKSEITDKTLTFDTNTNLNGTGLVFESGEWTLKGNANAKDLAGLDIAKNASVTWDNLTLEKGDLHKVGEGSLKVMNATNGNLRFGEGIVELGTSSAFNNIYITGQNATLKLGNNITNSTQHNSLDKKIFFAKGGGILDLNGHDQIFTQFSADNNHAKIINSNLIKETTLTLDLKANPTINQNGSSDDKGNPIFVESLPTQGVEKNAVIMHAHIGNTTKESSNNSKLNLNINSTNNQVTTILDGGFNVNHVTINNETILQSHPTTHASFRESKYNPSAKKPTQAEVCNEAKNGKLNYDRYYEDPKIQCLIETYKTTINPKLPDYMDITRPSTLTQPDWDKRTYTAQKVTIKSNATLKVTSSTDLKSDVELQDNATLILGDKTHYADFYDGENTTGNGFAYKQLVTSKNIDTIFKTQGFSNSINATKANITSYLENFAPSSLKMNGGTLNADYLTLKAGNQATLTDTKTEIKNLNIQGGTLTHNSTLNVNESLKMTSGNLSAETINLKNIKDFTQNQGTINAKTINLNNSVLNTPMNVNNLANLKIENHSQAYLDHLTLQAQPLENPTPMQALATIQNNTPILKITGDNTSNLLVNNLNISSGTSTLPINTEVIQNLNITQGTTQTILQGNDKTLTLANDAKINVKIDKAFSDEVVTTGNEIQRTISLPTLNDKRLIKDVFITDNSNKNYYYTYNFSGNDLIIKKSNENPLSNKALHKLSNNYHFLALLKNATNPTIEREFKAMAMTRNQIGMQNLVNKTNSDLSSVASLRDPNDVMFLLELENDPILRGKSEIFTKTRASNIGVSQYLGGHYASKNGFKIGIGGQAGRVYLGRATIQYNSNEEESGFGLAIQTSYAQLKEKSKFNAITLNNTQNASWQTRIIDSRVAGEYRLVLNSLSLIAQVVLGYQQHNNSAFSTQDFYAKSAQRQWFTSGAKAIVRFTPNRFSMELQGGITHFAHLGKNSQEVSFIYDPLFATYKGVKAKLQWFASLNARYLITQHFFLGASIGQSLKYTMGEFSLGWSF
ncbi:S6 family peptidase [Helicobacter cetorum]|uniref:Anti-codon nuclease masking agent n=1 Tax=Helicobacter cetorum (strain ATCC BAA-429 / MIT 00-7128) TaxID=182217 RepID=I0EKY5_HELC0|nr:S6 family peptidase [Helicobacter cetorum]AFI03604.1 anti-codon nuclease masking agent [Helicobacter cetorum MIT 00-7128]